MQFTFSHTTEGKRKRILFSNISFVCWATYKSICVRTFPYARVNIFYFLNIYFPLFYYYYYCYCYYCCSPLYSHRSSNWFRLYHFYIYCEWMKYALLSLRRSFRIISLPPHVMWRWRRQRWRRCGGKIENTGRLLTMRYSPAFFTYVIFSMFQFT